MPFFNPTGIYKQVAGNIIGGTGSLILNVSGVSNIGLGPATLGNNVAGSRNIAIGTSALNAQLSDDCVAIGSNSNALSTTGFRNISIGTNSLAALVNAGAANDDDNVSIGDNSAAQGTGAFLLQNVIIGSSAARGLISNSRYLGSVVIGYQAAQSCLVVSDSVVVGASNANLANVNSTVTTSVIIGKSVFTSGQNVSDSVLIGRQIADSLPGVSSITNSIHVGARCARNARGTTNILIGGDAAAGITVGNNNVILGANSQPVADVSDSIVIGESASLSLSSAWIVGKIGVKQAIKEGANAAMGVATLVAGTVTVANTLVSANSRLFYSVQIAGGVQGFLSSTRVNGTSFTINSTNALDTSTVAWEIKEPG